MHFNFPEVGPQSEYHQELSSQYAAAMGELLGEPVEVRITARNNCERTGHETHYGTASCADGSVVKFRVSFDDYGKDPSFAPTYMFNNRAGRHQVATVAA
jgi:hypothetical protein